MLPYLHLSMDRASGGAGGGGDDDPRAVRRKTRAMHLSFLKKTMRTMCVRARSRATHPSLVAPSRVNGGVSRV